MTQTIFFLQVAILLLILECLCSTAYGQVIGTDLCFCQPAVYKLQLNFSIQCPDSTVSNSTPGIVGIGCLIESRGQTENITDPFPILVSEVQIIEIGPTLEVVGQAVYTGAFDDGAILQYTSVILTKPSDISVSNLPKSFQVTITGINALEESLTQIWIIKYENDCGIFPLLTVGQQVGWTEFADLGDPPTSFCPVSPGPPGAVSISPIKSPSTSTQAASIIPTPTIYEPPYHKSKKIDCPPSIAPSSDKENNIESSKRKSKKKKKSKGKGAIDDVKKGTEHLLLRKLNVGPRPAPVASPTTLECPEHGSNHHKSKSDEGSDRSEPVHKKKQKIQEDRHDPSDYNDDDY